MKNLLLFKKRIALIAERWLYAALPLLAQRAFAQAAFSRFLKDYLSCGSPKLFVDPFECIGSDIIVYRDYYEGSAIRAFLNFINTLSDQPTLYVDVGANLGNHLVAFRGIYLKALAFEPVPHNYHLCKANLAYNGIDNAVVKKIALGDINGSVEISLPLASEYLQGSRRNNGMFQITAEPREEQPIPENALDRDKTESNYKIRARMAKCDDLLEPFLQGISRCIIKIDCEGHEVQVLKGMARTICNNSSMHFIFLVEFLSLSSALEALDAIIGFLPSSRCPSIMIPSENQLVSITDLRMLPYPQSMLVISLPGASSCLA